MAAPREKVSVILCKKNPLTRPRQGASFDDLPWRDRLGPRYAVGQAALQLRALCRGERGGLGLFSDAVPNRLGDGEAILGAEPVEAEFFDGGCHSNLLIDRSAIAHYI